LLISLNVVAMGLEIMDDRLLKRIIVDPRIMVGKPGDSGNQNSRRHNHSQDCPGRNYLPKITRQDIRAALEYAERLVRGKDVIGS
jgi:uncharacterized protein (DUF433 family)